MKVHRPPSFIPFGPAGHPLAKFFLNCEATTSTEAAEKLAYHLEKHTGLPFYFSKSIPLEEQGYFVMPVVDSEVSDEIFSSLAIPRAFQPQPANQPGRNLSEFTQFIKPDYRDSPNTVLQEGNAGCSHDFGLERSGIYHRDTVTGALLNELDAQLQRNLPYGSYYFVSTCRRCDALHGLAEKSQD